MGGQRNRGRPKRSLENDIYIEDFIHGWGIMSGEWDEQPALTVLLGRMYILPVLMSPAPMMIVL